MPTAFYVSKSGNDNSGDGSQELPFLTLSKALNVALNGDTIYVSAGEYNSFPAITKSVIIKGPNDGISGSNAGRLGEAVFKDIVSTSITGNDVTMDGLKFLQTGNTLELFIMQSQRVTIQNCIFERNAVTAGQTARAIVSSNDAENYLIKNNLFTGSIEGGLFGEHKTWNNGLFLNNNQRKTGTVEGNTFKNLRSAINLDDDNSLVTLKNNNLLNCGTYFTYGGTIPPTQGAITLGNIFDMNNSNTLINNSNVNALFKTSISINKFKIGDVSLSSSELSLEQKFLIESKLYHKGRSSKNGIVYFKDNEQFVISGLTKLTSALNFAPASGETIYLSAGTYTEDVLINKQVIISGVDKITTIIQSSNSSIVPPVQITDNSTGSYIKNLTVKGNLIQSTTGSGNSDNTKSGVLILNTVGSPEINNIILENLIISNASNGIAFNNKFSKNILIKNCEIKNNEGSGIRIASNVEMLDGFIVDNCTIRDNNLNAIALNPSGSYRPDCTNFVIKSSIIQNNNLLTTHNSHDVSFFGFNGNIEIRDTL